MYLFCDIQDIQVDYNDYFILQEDKLNQTQAKV